jgi:hypothetical protein
MEGNLRAAEKPRRLPKELHPSSLTTRGAFVIVLKQRIIAMIAALNLSSACFNANAVAVYKISECPAIAIFCYLLNPLLFNQRSRFYGRTKPRYMKARIWLRLIGFMKGRVLERVSRLCLQK